MSTMSGTPLQVTCALMYCFYLSHEYEGNFSTVAGIDPERHQSKKDWKNKSQPLPT